MGNVKTDILTSLVLRLKVELQNKKTYFRSVSDEEILDLVTSVVEFKRFSYKSPIDWIGSFKDCLNLVDIVSEKRNLKQVGYSFLGACPFHDHAESESDQFAVNKDYFYCSGCKEMGDVIRYVEKTHGFSYSESLIFLSKKYDLEIPIL